MGDRNIVKVADFGLARFVVDDEYTASEGTKFPIKWAAPEVITHAKFSSKSDVWSFGELGLGDPSLCHVDTPPLTSPGILLWELWTGGKTPYPTFTNSQVLDEVLMGYRLEKPKLCPPEIYDLMRKCWLPVSRVCLDVVWKQAQYSVWAGLPPTHSLLICVPKSHSVMHSHPGKLNSVDTYIRTNVNKKCKLQNKQSVRQQHPPLPPPHTEF